MSFWRFSGRKPDIDLYMCQPKISLVRRNLFKFCAKIKEIIAFKYLKKKSLLMNYTFPLRIYLKCFFFLSFWRFSGRKYKHIAVHKCYQSRQKTVPDQPAAIWLCLVIVQALLQQGRKQKFIHFLPLRRHRCYRCSRRVRCGHSYPSGKWLSNMQSQSWTLPSQG